MSEDRSGRVTVNAKPFGDTLNPQGFYQLLVAHLTWLATHNFSQVTVDKRGLYVRAFALWCLEADLPSPDLDHAQIEESFKKICVKVEQWSAWTEKAKQNHDLHLQDIAMERQSECAYLQQALQELLNASSDHRKVIAGQKNAINAKLAEVKRALAELPFMRRA